MLRDIGSVTEVHTGEKVFEAGLVDEAVEVVRVRLLPGFDTKLDARVRVGEKTVPLRRFLRPAAISGDHELDGILVVHGPGVKAKHRIRDASVLDISPTVLYVLGLPVGRDMDGTVLVDAFEERVARSHPIQFIDSHDAGQPPRDRPDEREVDSELIRRLQMLGYLQ